MFKRLGNTVARHPWRLIGAWIAIAVVLGMIGSAKLYDVTTDDQSSFLPTSYESARATEFGEEAFGRVSGASSVTALVKRGDGDPLTKADLERIDGLVAETRTWTPDEDAVAAGARSSSRVVGAESGPVGGRGEFSLFALRFKGNSADPGVQEAFSQFRSDAVQRFGAADLRVGFTGGAATMTDLMESTESTRALETALLYGAIVLLSLLFFRGLLAAILPLLAVTLVGFAATGLIVLGALATGLELDTSTPSLITTVLIGIGIDYFLFLAFRYRELLRSGNDRKDAAAITVRRVGEVIASAALAVVVAFATLGLAEYGQFKVLGPAIALSVLVMLAAGLTLFPALLAVAGRAMFWPSRSWRRERTGGPAARIGRLVARRPGRVAAASAAVLVVLGLGAIGVRMSYDLGDEPKGTESARVADEIAASLPRGATDPVRIYVRSDRPLNAAALEPMRRRIAAIDGVGGVSKPALARSARAAQLQVTLTMRATTNEALRLADGPVREAAHAATPSRSEAMVGGTSAVYADVSQSIEDDLRLIFPIAAGLILIILIVLLRSAIAPLYLLVAVGLEFVATLGAATLVYQGGRGESGVAFTLPLVLFLFVAALGTDYNVLIASRLREELRRGLSVADATAEAVRHAAPAIAAAGLVLASSFGTLMLYHDEATKQMGFAMAVGILLASLLVSTLLVPALTALAGRRAWWPGSASRPLVLMAVDEPARTDDRAEPAQIERLAA
jgi:putative drug exporter of the RND superfamily